MTLTKLTMAREGTGMARAFSADSDAGFINQNKAWHGQERVGTGLSQKVSLIRAREGENATASSIGVVAYRSTSTKMRVPSRAGIANVLTWLNSRFPHARANARASEPAIVSHEAMFHAGHRGTGRQFIRDYVPGGSSKCSRCDNSRAPGQRYCKPCRAAYMRAWRSNRLGVAQRGR